jgi:hypothetical protein
MPTNPLIRQSIETAYHSGSEIIVQLKTACSDAYQGRVQSVSGEYFTLFHSGKAGGILWAFDMADVLTCGLVIDAPSALIELDALCDSSTEASTNHSRQAVERSEPSDG